MRRTVFVKRVVPLLIAVMLVLCAGSVFKMGPKVYTEVNSGDTITVTKDEIFRVKLAENPSTGYSWEITTTPGLQRMGDQYSPSDRTGMLVGSGGVHGWDVKAMNTGLQKVEGVYMRPWEGPQPDDKRFVLYVNVQEKGTLQGLLPDIWRDIDTEDLSFPNLWEDWADKGAKLFPFNIDTGLF
ncbi:protease inhibitor I42 family protein [Methanooceanicella nereidis]|nr:protease inhibitor I42 family protein [Methanocella sp. CWC-04]